MGTRTWHREGREMGLREIREERKAKASGFTIEGCAAALGVTAPTYRKLEADPSLLTVGQTVKLARHLGVPVDTIILAAEGK